MVKIDKNRPKFYSIGQNFRLSHLRKALTITFGMIYNLSGFEEFRIVPLFIVMTSL